MNDPLVFYKALSEDTRLKTLMLLHQHCSLCVCDLTEVLELSQPKVSRHLAELRSAGLVDCERRGKWAYYQLSPELAAWQQQVIATTVDSHKDLLGLLEDKLPPLEDRETRC